MVAIRRRLLFIFNRRPAGKELFSLLSQSAIDKDSKPRLTIVPDGKLHLLPFDGLIDENGKYVLESHIVTYAPSATVLHLLRQSHSTDKLAMSFLGVGDVTYPRSVVTANASRRTTTKQNATADFFDLEGVTFPELPGSRQEALTVAGVMTGEKRSSGEGRHRSRLQSTTTCRFSSNPSGRSRTGEFSISRSSGPDLGEFSHYWPRWLVAGQGNPGPPITCRSCYAVRLRYRQWNIARRGRNSELGTCIPARWCKIGNCEPLDRRRHLHNRSYEALL
jgi:CHAT domain